jgi:hypothetical protein
MEYSFEGDELAGEGRPSVFTSALVRGLSSGEADRDRDGWISVDELYEFAYDEVRAVTPSQTPGKWVFDVQGDLLVARSRLEPEPEEAPGLPAELLAATKSPFAYVRAGAVEELAALLESPDEPVTAAAREALEGLAEDDSRRVAVAAAAALGGPEAAAPAPVERMPEPRPAPSRPPPPAVAEPPAPAYVGRILRPAAVALLAALPIPLIASSYEGWNLFAVLSPFEAVGAAVVVLWVARGLRYYDMATSLAAGVLLAVGVLTTVASFGLLKFSIERLDSLAIALTVVVLAGALAILAAGVACMRGSHAVAAVTPVDPASLLLGLGGAGLVFAALFVNYDGLSTLWSEVGEGESAEFFFEPAVAVALIVVGVVALGSRLRFASGMLIAAGGLTALHFLGLVFAAWRAVGEIGNVQAAGFLGMVGGLLAAAAGGYSYRSWMHSTPAVEVRSESRS